MRLGRKAAKDIRNVSTRSQLKLVRALQQKKYRDQEGLFLVQGRKLLQELLESDLKIERILASEAIAKEFDHSALEVLPLHELDRIGTLESGNEVIAVVRIPDPSGAIHLGREELAIALDSINDPGNLGTILRVADWFGIDHVICSLGSVDAYNPKCVQASMGAIFRVKVHYVDLLIELDRLKNNGASILLASMEGASVFDRKVERPAILVLGSESHGISDEVRAIGGTAISIPGSGRSESLNVATAAAALCMELDRQFRAG